VKCDVQSQTKRFPAVKGNEMPDLDCISPDLISQSMTDEIAINSSGLNRSSADGRFKSSLIS
jgi:hypothetical protein